MSTEAPHTTQPTTDQQLKVTTDPHGITRRKHPGGFTEAYMPFFFDPKDRNPAGVCPFTPGEPVNDEKQYERFARGVLKVDLPTPTPEK